MLHELLLALLGYTGDLIIDEREQEKSLGVSLSTEAPISEASTFKLAPDLSFIEPSERDVIERIITLGFYYRELERFASKSRNLSWIRSSYQCPLSRTAKLVEKRKEKQSLYRRAIANGIVEVLSVYRSAVLQIEQLLLSDSVPILATVTKGLNKFFVLLPPLHELIVEIERDGICGGRLLNLLHKRCHCGVPELQTCIQRYGSSDQLLGVDVYRHILFVKKSYLYNWRRGPSPKLSKVEKVYIPKGSSSHNTDTVKLLVCASLIGHRGSQCRAYHTVNQIEIPVHQIYRLLWHGHQVMYNQLASWMVYGILNDQHEEFFISRQEDKDRDHDTSRIDVLEKFSSLSTVDASLTDWNLGFHICLDMLPEYIPMRVAEYILFAGKAVRVLRNPSPSFRLQDAVHYQQKPRGSQRFPGFTERFSFEKEPSLDVSTGEELLPQSEADKIESMLQALKESSEFHKRSFECAVDSIRVIAASHLWQLVVVRANLNGHLRALKDYFLLAKGDFFQSFLEESRQLMRLPPRQSTAEADLMVPFQLAAIKTMSDEDKYFSRVSLRISSFGVPVKSSKADSSSNVDSKRSSDTSEMSLDGWDGIALEYSLDWPLELFFTQEVLSKYRRIFQYLLRLKRTQMELEKSWASVMHQVHTDFAKHRKDHKNTSMSHQRRQRFAPKWRVREHMAFLIRNLQFYIQVDVIESQWNVLQAHIQDSHDFTELVGFHQEYLSALISQSFLDIGSVSRILDGIMKLCMQFCWNIENQETDASNAELEHITEEFNKKSNSLYTILRSSRLAGSQRAPFLRRFLLRLNFNSFFEATARGVLNVVRPRPTTTI